MRNKIEIEADFNAAADKALKEMADENFWREVGPALEKKLKLAGRHIFSKGAEFGIRKFVDVTLGDVVREKACQK